MSDSQLTLALSMELDEKANVYDILGNAKKAKLKFNSDEYSTTQVESVDGLICLDTSFWSENFSNARCGRNALLLNGNAYLLQWSSKNSSNGLTIFKITKSGLQTVVPAGTILFNRENQHVCAWVYKNLIYINSYYSSNNIYTFNGTTATKITSGNYVPDPSYVVLQYTNGSYVRGYSSSGQWRYYHLRDTYSGPDAFNTPYIDSCKCESYDCAMNGKIYAKYWESTSGSTLYHYGRFSASGSLETTLYTIPDSLMDYSCRFPFRNNLYCLKWGTGTSSREAHLYKDNLNGTMTDLGSTGIENTGISSANLGDRRVDTIEYNNDLYIGGLPTTNSSYTDAVTYGVAKFTYYGDIIPKKSSTKAVNSCCAVLNDKIYMFGGNYAHELLYYDIEHDTKDRLIGVPFAVNKGISLPYNGNIHVIYGTSHYKFDGTNFTQQTNCPVSLTSKAATVFNGAIHVIQGTSHRSFSNGSWTTVSTVPVNVTLGALAVVNNELHLIANTNLHYVYRNGSWVSLGTTPTSIANASVVTANNIIYIIGGTANPKTIYSYENGNWGAKASIPYDHLQGTAVYHDGAIYIIGGTATDSIVKLAPGSSISTVITFNLAKMRELGIV